MRFDFSCRRLYGFCSRLCPRQVLGFSALSSASSWIFLAKLAEDLTKNNENQVKSGGVWGGVAPPARAAENMPKVSQENNLVKSEDPPAGAATELPKVPRKKKTQSRSGRSPPSKSSQKHAQSKQRSSRNHPKTFKKRALTPQKSTPEPS